MFFLVTHFCGDSGSSCRRTLGSKKIPTHKKVGMFFGDHYLGDSGRMFLSFISLLILFYLSIS